MGNKLISYFLGCLELFLNMYAVRGGAMITRSMTRGFMGLGGRNFVIQDNPQDYMLRMAIGDDLYATVIYEKDNDIYNLIHSEIPTPAQGKGLGKILAEVCANFNPTHC